MSTRKWKLTNFPKVPTGLFIDNQFIPAAGDALVEVENPATGTLLAKVSAAQPADVEKAVASSSKAFRGSWRYTAPEERRRLLNRLGDLIERDGEELASLEAVDAGMLYAMSLSMSVGQAAEACRYFAGWADKIQGRTMRITEGMAYTKRHPIGVCAAIIPWNAPL
jgi:aldehyde dehydrogenase (NAD+)